MTTYTAIPNGDIDQDSPVTQPLMTLMRDNPIAIAEADSTVAANLRPTVSLGTLATTSGASQTITSLDLTPYQFITLVFDKVIGTGAGGLSVAGAVVYNPAGNNERFTGHVNISLADGIGASVMANVTGTSASKAEIYVIDTTISTATTSIAVAVATGAFNGGSVEFWGIK